ncbi:MAG TPA: MFS transporter [Bacillota bacterium]|nr:MFS transporter [Bacillota bacterium]HOC07043.1 MFS transporter [Bacillota bacterium]HPZ22801.1 MFS transporter [Bacillota bacterium]
MKRTNVWSKDFTLITIGTVISAIAGQTISLPFSLMVFDQTQSAFLSAIMFVSGMLPNFILPLFIAPLIDRGNKKKIIVTLDYLTGAFFLLVALIVSKTGFNYHLFVAFTFIAGIIGTIYQLTYIAWYPDLIPVGFEQQGYAVSSSIYPTVIMVMSPVAAWLYKVMPMHLLLIMIGFLTFVAATFELFISNQGFQKKTGVLHWKEYLADCKAGLSYLRKEKGLQNIYSYMAITNGVATGVQLMVQAYFQSVQFLTVAMLAFLRTAETLGRMLGGLVQYKVKIKPEKRFGITKFVYFTYETFDILLLYLPYPLMIVNRFICGVLGITSYTLRESSVQSYLPRDMRAKVNAIFNVATSFTVIIFQLGVGSVGDLLGYRRTVVLFTAISMAAIIGFIAIPSTVNRKVYEATRQIEDVA